MATRASLIFLPPLHSMAPYLVPCGQDLNDRGDVNVTDLLVLLGGWGHILRITGRPDVEVLHLKSVILDIHPAGLDDPACKYRAY